MLKEKHHDISDTLEVQNRRISEDIVGAAKSNIPRGKRKQKRKPFLSQECDNARDRYTRSRKEIEIAGGEAAIPKTAKRGTISGEQSRRKKEILGRKMRDESSNRFV